MKNLLKPVRYGLIPVLAISITLTACQKEPEPKAPVNLDTQSTPITSEVNTDQQPVDNLDETNVETEREINLDVLDDIDKLDKEVDSQEVALNPEQAIKGTQITDVQYRSNAGESLSVVFETSASGVLNAIVTQPNRPKMTLSAPEGQGNNPIYRSQDGSIELISHGGGSSIDLLRDGEVTSYDATSAEAEVVAES